jgi:hypothetical protein
MRYIQTAVSDEVYKLYRNFSFDEKLTLGELIETATTEYVKQREGQNVNSEAKAVVGNKKCS